VFKDHKEHQAQTATPGLQVFKDHLVHKGQSVHKDRKEHQAPLGMLGQ
jgi:hypothetical protein